MHIKINWLKQNFHEHVQSWILQNFLYSVELKSLDRQNPGNFCTFKKEKKVRDTINSIITHHLNKESSICSEIT